MAVLAESRKSLADGAPALPGFLMRSPDPALMRLRLAWMFAYRPRLAISGSYLNGVRCGTPGRDLGRITSVLEAATGSGSLTEQTLPSDAVALAGLSNLKGLRGLTHRVLAEHYLLLKLRLLRLRVFSLYLNIDSELQVSEVEVGHEAILLHHAATSGWLSATS